MKTTLKVGDKLYAMIAPSYGRPAVLTEVEISKVGTKYLYADGDRFQIEKDKLQFVGGRHYPAPRQFYKTEKELVDIQELWKMREDIRGITSYGSLKATDDQIRSIHKILFPEYNENKPE